MKVRRCFAIVLPLVMVAAGCGRKESSRVTAPRPPIQEPQIVEARWVFEKDALDGAVQNAASSPLVQHAIAAVQHPRLTRVFAYAVRVVGKASDGARVGTTILPYIVDGDSTHAVFISLLERDGKQMAEAGELILGREPTALETGFRPIRLWDRIGWVKDGNSYVAVAVGQPRLVTHRFRLDRFVTCFLAGAAAACEAGATVARNIAPNVPFAAAVGCGVGVGLLAAGCGYGSFER